MSRDQKFRLTDILEAISKIENYTKELDLNSFLQNEMVRDAVVRNIEVIGEAAKMVPETIKVTYPEIPWKEIIAIRNLIAHEYFRVDYNVIFNTCIQDLPNLKSLIQNILSH
jgi:uncharacterized protein with HEPN domain